MGYSIGRRLIAAALAVIAWGLVHAQPAAAEERLALIIANQAYTQPSARLPSTHATGDIVKVALAKAGYKVTTIRDTRLDVALRKAINDHIERVKAAGADAKSIIYFAGHAASDRPDGETYLLPTDVPLESPERLSWAGVSLGSISDVIAKSGTSSLLVVDGCRGLFIERQVRIARNGMDASGCTTPRPRAGVVVMLVRKPPGAGFLGRLTGRGQEPLFPRSFADELGKAPAGMRDALEAAARRVEADSKGNQTVSIIAGPVAVAVSVESEPSASAPPVSAVRGAQTAARPAPPAAAARGAPAPAPAGIPPPPPAPAPSAAAPPAATPDADTIDKSVDERRPMTRSARGGAAADWDVVPVYYGTNRASENNVKRASYSFTPTNTLELGQALVTVPRVHKVPNLERPWVYKVPFTQVVIYGEPEDPAKHFTLKEVTKLSEDEWLRLVAARLGASKTYEKHALIFVHGFNTTFDNALFRTAQIAYDLKFDGAPFVYSWPSKGALDTAAYRYDRETAGSAQPHLRDFIELVAGKTGATRVSIIAHSMGHQVLMPVLEALRRDKPKGVAISEVILAAPDMDRLAFENIARQLKGFGRGITLYASQNDVALKASRQYWGGDRAGDVPPQGPIVVSGIDTIDVSNTSSDWFGLNHSTYAERTELIDDIAKLLRAPRRQAPPVRDPSLLQATATGGVYWKFPPRPAAGSAVAAPVAKP